MEVMYFNNNLENLLFFISIIIKVKSRKKISIKSVITIKTKRGTIVILSSRSLRLVTISSSLPLRCDRSNLTSIFALGNSDTCKMAEVNDLLNFLLTHTPDF
jgi:DNA helicase TIP49 (TBP-interacting protein)